MPCKPCPSASHHRCSSSPLPPKIKSAVRRALLLCQNLALCIRAIGTWARSMLLTLLLIHCAVVLDRRWWRWPACNSADAARQ